MSKPTSTNPAPSRPACGLEATIVAVGADSTVPSRPDAVDLEVFRVTPDGRSLLGMVTLLRNESNVHAEWGDPDTWAEDPVVAYMAGRSIDRPHQFDLKPARVAEVLRVCRDAIRAEEPFDRPE